ncbi:hypothetical protein K0M31_010433 [Melipona bicolor]|uniref:Uncharacterized protein n=1 Tax=Melipona bicolor TaxID=60889 RepID=A0AA40KIR5_9HYME|nr:hypothetical protein K0M31_010433 [Melipona bicolor]
MVIPFATPEQSQVSLRYQRESIASYALPIHLFSSRLFNLPFDGTSRLVQLSAVRLNISQKSKGRNLRTERRKRCFGFRRDGPDLSARRALSSPIAAPALEAKRCHAGVRDRQA